MQPPTTHCSAHRLGRLVANRRGEADEQLPGPVHRAPGPKRIAQEVEALLWIAVAPVAVLAVDDLRLLRMQLQLAHRKPRFQHLTQLACLCFANTVADGIIGVALKRDIGVVFPASSDPTHSAERDSPKLG